jgi:hypothetical protein
MPFEAKRSRDCCWVSPRVSAFKPLKMIGSALLELEKQYSILKFKEKRTVGNDDGVISFNRLINYGFGKVNGQEDRVHLSAERIEGSFK